MRLGRRRAAQHANELNAVRKIQAVSTFALRLQRTYFSSKDQLLTLALTANLNANVFTLAREVGVPVVQHLVGNDSQSSTAGACPRRAVAAGRRIYPLPGNQRCGVAIDQRHRRPGLDLRPDRVSLGGYSHESSSNHSGAPRDNLSNHCLLESLEAENAGATEVSGASSKPRSLTRGTIPRRSPPCKILRRCRYGRRLRRSKVSSSGSCVCSDADEGTCSGEKVVDDAPCTRGIKARAQSQFCILMRVAVWQPFALTFALLPTKRLSRRTDRAGLPLRIAANIRRRMLDSSSTPSASRFAFNILR
jgi:hypothetical protein